MPSPSKDEVLDLLISEVESRAEQLSEIENPRQRKRLKSDLKHYVNIIKKIQKGQKLSKIEERNLIGIQAWDHIRKSGVGWDEL